MAGNKEQLLKTHYGISYVDKLCLQRWDSKTSPYFSDLKWIKCSDNLLIITVIVAIVVVKNMIILIHVLVSLYR